MSADAHQPAIVTSDDAFIGANVRPDLTRMMGSSAAREVGRRTFTL